MNARDQKSLEQWARDILEKAIRDELVRRPAPGTWGSGATPQARSAGELVGVANMLRDLIVAHDQRWHPGQPHTEPR